MKLLISIVLFMVIFISYSGCKKTMKSEILGNFKEISRFNVNFQAQIYPIMAFNDNFVMLDWKENDLRVVDKNGILICSYKKIGKGPGEFYPNRVYLVGTYDTSIAVVDCERNIFMFFDFDPVKKELHFRDQFSADKTQIIHASLGKDRRIYCSIEGSDYRYYVYTLDGTLEKKLFKLDDKSLTDPDIWILNRFRQEIRFETGLYSISRMNYQMDFYADDGKNDLQLVRQRKPEFMFILDNFQIKKNGQKIQLSGQPGIINPALLNDNLIFTVIPDDNEENIFIQSYTPNGDYAGKYTISIKDKKNLVFLGSNGKDSVYFIHGDLNSRSQKELITAVLEPIQI